MRREPYPERGVRLFLFGRREKNMAEKKKEEEGMRGDHGYFLPGHKPLWVPPKGNSFASKYREEYCERIVEFFSAPYFVSAEDEDGTKHVGACVYPTFESFAATIGVISETLREWADKHERFRAAYEYAKQLQRDKLIVHGMSGAYNPAFAKFIASTTHGMVEKSAVDVGNADDKPFEVNITVVDKVGQ